MQQPIAPRYPHVWNRPTGEVEDPWAWLRDREHPDTIAYLQAENAYADEWFGQHDELQATLFDEIKSRVQETDLSAPVRHRGWWYVSRTLEGSSYAIHCRGTSPETATEQVLIDENVEAAGHDYFAMNAFDLNADHSLLAWSSDTDGSERYTMRIRDLVAGTDREDRLSDTTWGGTAWSTDSHSLFYVTPDDQMRPHRVWRHTVGTPQTDDVMVFEDTDERFFVSVDLTRSGEWIVIESRSHLSGEAWLIPAADPTAAPRLVRARRPEVEYSIDHWGDQFVVLTNENALDFTVKTAPVDRPEAWTELVPHVAGQRILAVEPFADHLILHEWADAQPRLRVLFRDGTQRSIDLGSDPHDVELEANPDWAAPTVRYLYQSFTTPATVYEEHVGTGDRTMLKQTPVPNTDLSQYVASREWATSPDGTRVPLDIVRHRDTAADGSAAGCVYAYASYEVSSPPWFSVARLSILDRGMVWVLAHPRGGGELGRGWYEDGRLLNKRNTFVDTISCAEHLIAQRWVSPSRLAVRGGSAGGLLVGASITLRPDLFAAAIAEVPFVDVVTTMSDPSLPLTITEWDEWGDPRAEPFASYMLGYSPYDNTVATNYPAIYVTAGLNDPRVSYHEPAKWVAKLRATRTNEAPLLLKCEMGAGHGGPSGRYDRWHDEARALTFLLTTLG